jgi:hypothetical protein
MHRPSSERVLSELVGGLIELIMKMQNEEILMLIRNDFIPAIL